MAEVGGTADLIIVGAGSAGCVLASRLSEKPKLRILLVEAGQEPTDPRIADPASWPLLQGTAVDWDYGTTPQPDMAGRAHPWPRGKVVGGSSAIHAMGHMRGHRADFDAWVEAGATGWGWDDLLPYFIKSESSPFADRADPASAWYGSNGPIHLEQPAEPHPLTQAHRAAGAALGLAPLRDHNGPDGMAGPTLNTMTIKDGKRQSVADAYLTPAVRARANLDVRTGVHVDRLLISADRIVGIRALRDGAPIELEARHGVVLAAGAIASPLILMRSGLGRGDDLKAAGIDVVRDIAGVGGNLQDHLLSAGNVYRSSRSVPPTGTQHSESLTYIHAQDQHRSEAPQLVVGCVTAPIVSDALAGEVAALAPGEAYTLMFGITHPRSRGRMQITSADPCAKPVIDPAYLSDQTDRQHFLQALDWARALGAADAYGDWRDRELLPRQQDMEDVESRLAFIERAAFTHHHPVGTCAMGTCAHGAGAMGTGNAVVTPQLELPDLGGLWVCDGSVLPSLTTGPVNAAIVAVAEKASDMFRDRMR